MPLQGEGQDAVLARIDERTKNTDKNVTDQGRKLDDLRQHLDTNFATKDTVSAVQAHLTTFNQQLAAVKSDCTREVEGVRGELSEVRTDLQENYATCERVADLEGGLLDSETATKLKELVAGDEPEKRAVKRGEVDLMKKLVYGACALVLIAVVTAALAFVVHAPK